MIMSDYNLRKLIKSKKLEIDPLSEDSIQQNGVDFRVADEMGKRVCNKNKKIIDSSSSSEIRESFQIIKSNNEKFVMEPLQHYLLTTLERVKMPDDLMGFCGLRSTFARLGFISPLTIIDAGFNGTLTIGVFYGGNTSISLPVGCRFLHVVFAKLENKVDIAYNGHYNSQMGISLPKKLT